MRAAPAVDYPLARSGFWRAGAGLAAALACACAAVWAVSSQEVVTLSAWVLCLAGALAGGFLGWRWSCPARTQLQWNGECWHLCARQGPAEPGDPEIALDWGDWMLLRWHAGRGGWRRFAPRCLPVAREDLPGRWHVLRVALHGARPRRGAP